MMNWIAKTLWTSIGKKLLMACTGLCFCGFLTVHLFGNLTLYGGSASFGAYAEKLHELGWVITVTEWGLVLFALIHVTLGLTLFIENRLARPERYHRHKRTGGRTIGSATMPYTGFVVLGFLIYHLLNFRFAGVTGASLYPIVRTSFSQPARVMFYAIAVGFLAVHLSHGFWSAFQSLGADHIKYTPLIKAVRTLFCLMVAIGFGSIPIYMLLSS